ncbi:hypothetical protein RKD27_009157 [Streptomyces sp. SAI-126]|nr:hypothetical protein [Streptomyces sp. SAI-119]MDH6502347.1 hypothetical protein [Streptomyces sp. SAI-149]
MGKATASSKRSHAQDLWIEFGEHVKGTFPSDRLMVIE